MAPKKKPSRSVIVNQNPNPKGEKTVVNFKLKGALISEFGSQAAAAKTLKAAGCPGMNERRLSRLIHGFEAPRPEEARIIRERVGIELNVALREKASKVLAGVDNIGREEGAEGASK